MFSLKYLVNFSKSSSLSNTVQLMVSNDVPLLVSCLLMVAFCFRIARRPFFWVVWDLRCVTHDTFGFRSRLACCSRFV